MFRFRSEYEPIGLTSQQLHSNEENNICVIYGYHKRSCGKQLLFHLFGILSFGLFYAFVGWYPQLKSFKLTKCTLSIADTVLVKDANNNYETVAVQSDMLHLQQRAFTNLKYFIYRHNKYVLDDNDGLFKPLDDLMPKLTLSDILENSRGITENEKTELLNLYGSNNIDVEVRTYWNVFVNEVYNPFYLFQAFSVVLWCVDDYVIYSVCVLILTFFSVVTTLYQTRKQDKALHNLVKSSKTDSAKVLRPNIISGFTGHDIPSRDIVPGDLLVIPRSGCLMPCDAVLITGNCIVNESMLTGESTPVTKTAPHTSSEIYDTGIHKRYTLFCGTSILQARYYEGEFVLARVIKTGFTTMKGELVKSMLFPAPIKIQFYKDSAKFLLFLSIIAAGGMAYCTYLYHKRGADLEYIIIRTLDIVTIVVPPALPAAMTISIAYSQSRLKHLNIFCTSPPRINLAGKIKLACFDKTGTLTEDGVQLNSIIPSVDGKFSNPETHAFKIDSTSSLVKAMATCHSLTRIMGQLKGDSLDITMFESTKWEIEEPGEKESTRYDMLAPVIVKPNQNNASNFEIGEDNIPYCIGIIREFPFSSVQQCMTVICRELNDPCMIAFTKGAPERIKSFCREESLPQDFHLCLSTYTSQGFRVIAFSCKKLSSKFKWKEAQKTKREVLECDMTFLGFMIMQNSLKPETIPVIRTLHDASIPTVMITGDNIMTAICVARECNMIKADEPIVLVNMELDNDLGIPKMIFEVVDDDPDINFYDKKYHLAMDGKTWDKLREYYADYLPHILVKSTIFARFQPDQKTQLINYFQKIGYIVSMVGDGANDCGFHSMLGNIQLLFIDLIITTSLAVTIGHQGPANKLQSERPMGSLVCARNLIPLITQVLLCIAVQFCSYYYLSTQSWFVPLPPGKEEVILCWENTVIFMVSSYQYIIMAFVYAKGKPFRKTLITNFWFLLSAISLTSFLTWLYLKAPEGLAKFFEVMYLPHNHPREQRLFRDTLLLLPLLHLLLALFIEAQIADRKWFKKFLQFLFMKRKPKNKYKILLKENVVARWLASPEFNVTLSVD
ncbi:probable cation-transporting ATPase 13A3 isoform X2 [Agrilus planipennis]|uniref:Cation-transporting ATPase n=1 Tax=Agrilus planipennis TaxID=224129 RepID=A0A1W4XER6_AGRPL|nr:probable cation-transporting ATPase 13A3 isoform X2 [Agrilus planipennis]